MDRSLAEGERVAPRPVQPSRKRNRSIGRACCVLLPLGYRGNLRVDEQWFPLRRRAPFDDRQQLVGGNIFEDVDRPLRGQWTSIRSTRLCFAQAEMQPRSPVALVAAAAVDLVHLPQLAGHDVDPGPDAVTVGFHAAEPDLDPMVAGHGFVSQDRRLVRWN